ncbi:MAG: ABC transporter substrate-binding protein, partial [Hyphomicrobiales bacterium]|nr:ABC transporter substrate-binding protein [Hyphomicrobiales bacterium]
MTARIDRRSVVGGLAAGAMLAPGASRAALPPLPKSPVALSIIDVGGALALLQAGFEA